MATETLSVRVEALARPGQDPGYTEARCPACRKLLGRWINRSDGTPFGSHVKVEFETQCPRGSCRTLVRLRIG